LFEGYKVLDKVRKDCTRKDDSERPSKRYWLQGKKKEKENNRNERPDCSLTAMGNVVREG